MKRLIVRYWPLITVLAFAILAWAILYPVYLRVRENSTHVSCQSYLKQLGLGVMQYLQDYDERLPLIRVHSVAESVKPFNRPYGWADALYPYLGSSMIYQCPQEPNAKHGAQDAVASQFTDYYYNTNLDGVAMKILSLPDKTILFGDGNDGTDGTDARYNRNVIPKAWLSGEKSPFQRHLGGSNFAFADGHVKWLKPEQVKAQRVTKNTYSFDVK